jgi:hypothetical protein
MTERLKQIRLILITEKEKILTASNFGIDEQALKSAIESQK